MHYPSDGTGREPRPAQKEVYKEIKDSLETSDVVAANLPTGLGKSFIARALQREHGNTDIVTSANELISQYLSSYEALNAVMGRDKYATAEEYTTAHRNAKAGQPSIFNPLSYHFAKQRGLRTPDMVIVDEAHLLVDMITYLSGCVIPIARTGVPENAKNEGELIKWCYNRYDRLKAAISTDQATDVLIHEFERIARLRDTLNEGSQHQVFEISKAMVPLGGKKPQKCMILTPVRVPDSLIRAVTAGRKVVGLSATLSRYDAEVLAAGRSLTYIQKDSPTPPENRPVYYNPVDPDLRKDPQALADKIMEIYNANPVPTLIHVTYLQAEQLKGLLGKIRPLVNAQNNKAEIKRQFLRYGGIWLCSGMSEGLDLPHDACRQVIVPTLLYPNRGELFVQKRVGLPDGQLWYDVRTIGNTIQRLGRAVRAEDDWCVSHVLDPQFSSVYPRVADQFPSLNVIWQRSKN